MILDWTSLQQSLDALDAAIEEWERLVADPSTSPALQKVVRAGVIQGFEVAYEQAWKALRRKLLQSEGAETVDPLSRRDLFRLAHGKRLIEDPVAWLRWHESRNLSSHTYAGDTAQAVALQARELAQGARLLLNRLLQTA